MSAPVLTPAEALDEVPDDRGARLRNWFVDQLRSPLKPLAAILVVAIVLLIAYPLIGVVWRTYGPGSQGFAQILSGGGDRFWEMLRNTAIIVFGSGAIGMVIGIALAWVHQRTDANLGWVGELLPLSTLLMPLIASVVGWVILLDPKVGYLNVLIRQLTGNTDPDATGPIDIFSLPALVAIASIYLVPYVFLMMTAAFQLLDSSLEEASRVSGASRARTFFKVLLPSVGPALGATSVMVLIRAFSAFTVVVVIGTRNGVETLPVYIYHLIGSTFPPKTGLAVLLAFVMLVVVQLLISVQSRLTRRGRNVAIGGKGGGVRRTSMRRARRPIQVVLALYLVVTAVLPALAVLVLSFQPFWSATIDPSQFSLKNYASMFTGGSTLGTAIGNSMLLAALGATVLILVSVVIGVAQRAASSRLRRFTSGVMAVPALIPHTLIGVAFVIAFSPPPFSLYGTLTLVFLAYILMEMPYASQSVQGVINSISPELPEAARVHGASELRAFARVLIPLMLSSLAAGWIITFIHMTAETTASVFLAGVNNPVVGAVMIKLTSDGTYPQVAALAVLLTLISTALVLIVLVLRRRSVRHL